MKTAEEYRQLAKESYADAVESFDRCDTDGFVSQWVSNLSGHKYNLQAKLVEDGGYTEDVALFFNGELASTHRGSSNFYGSYSHYWVLNDAAAEKYGKRFFNPSKAKNSTERDRQKGFTYGAIKVKGYVGSVGSGTGLSGLASVEYRILPVVECLKKGEFEVISSDGYYDESE